MNTMPAEKARPANPTPNSKRPPPRRMRAESVTGWIYCRTIVPEKVTVPLLVTVGGPAGGMTV